MQFKAILLGACAVALASAQSTVLTFTRVPNPITAGDATAITYATNDTDSPVTILLRKGISTNLQNVATLTSDATGGQFIWTPSKSLSSDNDYALEIKQGEQINYFGPFSIQGGNAAPSSYSSSSSASHTTSHTGIASISSSSIIALTTMSSNATMPALNATATAGTGTVMSRNTTMSTATLTSHSSVLTASTTTSETGTSTRTGGAGFQGTHSPSATTGAASDLKAGSSIALVFGAIAAVLYA